MSHLNASPSHFDCAADSGSDGRNWCRISPRGGVLSYDATAHAETAGSHTHAHPTPFDKQLTVYSRRCTIAAARWAGSTADSHLSPL